MTFLAIDISGAVFSLLSLIFKDKFDGIAAITYLGVVVSTGPCPAHVPITVIQSLHIYTTNLDMLFPNMGLFNCNKQHAPPSVPVPWKKVLDGVIVVLAWTLNPIKKRKTHEQALEQGMGAVDTAPETLETQSRITTSREREDRQGEKNIESDEA